MLTNFLDFVYQKEKYLHFNIIFFITIIMRKIEEAINLERGCENPDEHEDVRQLIRMASEVAERHEGTDEGVVVGGFLSALLPALASIGVTAAPYVLKGAKNCIKGCISENVKQAVGGVRVGGQAQHRYNNINYDYVDGYDYTPASGGYLFGKKTPDGIMYDSKVKPTDGKITKSFASFASKLKSGERGVYINSDGQEEAYARNPKTGRIMKFDVPDSKPKKPKRKLTAWNKFQKSLKEGEIDEYKGKYYTKEGFRIKQVKK